MIELARKFPDEGAARRWFESKVWPAGRCCPRCGSVNTFQAKHRSMPYRCRDCRAYFSVRTGTALEASKVPLLKWFWAVYLESNSVKGIASTTLAKQIGVTQKTAWFMLHRLRKAWGTRDAKFAGPMEADETYVGGKEKNKHRKDRAKGVRGSVGKSIVAGIKDRATGHVVARVVNSTTNAALSPFVRSHRQDGARVFTDEHQGYNGVAFREMVCHSRGQYVDGDVHTNGIESFWSILKRSYMGVHHWMSPKHLQRYVDGFTGRTHVRHLGTLNRMAWLVRGLVGKRLCYRDLVADP